MIKMAELNITSADFEEKVLNTKNTSGSLYVLSPIVT